MTVLAAMGDGKARRIGETARRAMHHFRHQRQGTDRAGTDAWHQQKLLKIFWSLLCRCGQIAVQPPQHNIAAAHVMMIRQIQMRQENQEQSGLTFGQPFQISQHRQLLRAEAIAAPRRQPEL